ncbi:SYEP-like protein [Mya arenaria]|uniref:proline--tRNA ligase n=1 Tax=Mya arenaria TaxID=6604 RepID=A0ABY7FKD2_MYAAR|nr:SYEP-like protein [Mya arenaria]
MSTSSTSQLKLSFTPVKANKQIRDYYFKMKSHLYKGLLFCEPFVPSNAKIIKFGPHYWDGFDVTAAMSAAVPGQDRKRGVGGGDTQGPWSIKGKGARQNHRKLTRQQMTSDVREKHTRVGSQPGKSTEPAGAPNWEMADGPEAAALGEKIKAKERKVRDLKVAKYVVDKEVSILLTLKALYKILPEEDLSAAGRQDKKKGKGDNNGKNGDNKENRGDKQTYPCVIKQSLNFYCRLCIEAKKEENLSDWYSQIITKAELIEYYDVSGFYILRPWSYSIWEIIKDFFDTAIKQLGLAWVTKPGKSKLDEQIAIRHSSETIIYPAVAKWIKTHRDLPLKLNQWCNVVRWEFKHPQPFLRSREFLWQEGHTTWSNKEDACEEVIIGFYAVPVYEYLMAIPVVRGRKTEKEKLDEVEFTLTVEAYIPASGRAIQMFEVVYEDPETHEKKYVFQNCWGLTTRTIGVMCMVHGDNKGLVLPPRVACLQADTNKLMSACEALKSSLEAGGVRVKADLRDYYSPGWKCNYWELKGVPLRIELGTWDMKQNQVVIVRRDTGEKLTIKNDNLVQRVKNLLETIQKDMFDKAKKDLDSNMTVSHNWDEFCNGLDQNKLIQAPFCGEITCEDAIKKDSARDVVVEEGEPDVGAKGLCIPFKQPQGLDKGTKCIHPDCTREANNYTLFGRSY